MRSNQITFDVDRAASVAHPMEYLEAVMSEVASFITNETIPAGQLAVVNRRVACIVNPERSRARLMLLSELEASMNDAAKAELNRWRDLAATKFHVLPVQVRIAGGE